MLVEPDGIEPTTSSMPLKLSGVFRPYHDVSVCVNSALPTGRSALHGTSDHLIGCHRFSATLEPLWNLERPKCPSASPR
jgi:hypothetical protein